MDFVIELLPQHLDPKKLPTGVNEVNYKFDVESARWRLDTAKSKDKEFTFKENNWKEIQKEIK